LTKRLHSLDGLRGLAAYVVVLWHFAIGFAPARLGTEPAGHGFALIGSPLFFLFNGPGAVTLFFTLSGFVLTHPFFVTGDILLIHRGALKRYFRLAGMSLAAVMISYALYSAGAFDYIPGEVERLPASWFQTMAGSYLSRRHVSFGAALAQGTVTVFTNGDAYFNTNLWTMRFELFGSFMVFALAAMFRGMKPTAIVFVSAILAILFHFIADYYYMAPFLVGLMLAHLHSRFPESRTPIQFALPLIVGCLLLFSFYNGSGMFGFAAFLNTPNLDRWRCYLQTASSAGLIWAAMTSGPFSLALSTSPVRFLGRISFAMYAIHTLIYFSAIGPIYLFAATRSTGDVAMACAFLASIVLIFPLSFALTRADEAWMRFVSRIIKPRADQPSNSEKPK
jgi:peptidoglycan/LPS O-acetylase OafA/YrhL